MLHHPLTASNFQLKVTDHFSAKSAYHENGFTLLHYPGADLIKTQIDFGTLPLDHYLDSPYRYRKLAYFDFRNGLITRVPSRPFYQPPGENALFGGMNRNFAELPETFTNSYFIHDLLHKFLSVSNLHTQTLELRIHAIRIIANREITGLPAPEGVHRDGALAIALFCVDRSPNIAGGITQIFSADHVGNPLVEVSLEPNDLFISNDQSLLHYTSPIRSVNGAPGYRDVLVLWVGKT